MKTSYTPRNIFLCFLVIFIFTSCAQTISLFEKTPFGKEKQDPKPSKKSTSQEKEKKKKEIHTSSAVMKGNASFYKKLPSMSKLTASGEPFDDRKMTAAHPDYPFGTKLKVTNLENNKSVVVRVNDRGPFVEDRIIDISLAAAKKIGMVDAGITVVSIEEVSQ
jgi:rare lipoprotein A